MTGNDTRLLVVTGGVTSKFEDLGGQVLEDGSEVDCSMRAKSEAKEVSRLKIQCYDKNSEREAEVEYIPGAPAPTRWA